MRTAILIDGAFYRKRVSLLIGSKSPHERSKELIEYCYKHLASKDDLYRIFYYDCPPISKSLCTL